MSARKRENWILLKVCEDRDDKTRQGKARKDTRKDKTCRLYRSIISIVLVSGIASGIQKQLVEGKSQSSKYS
eukprot:762784-Hanusia_phi.AAC.1